MRTVHAPSIARLTPLALDIAAAGENVAIPGVPGKPLLVYRGFFVVASGVSIIYRNGVGGANFLPAIGYTANGSHTLPYDTEPWFTTDIGAAFVMVLSAPVQVSGVLYFLTHGLTQ
jgi:hypothetical protein